MNDFTLTQLPNGDLWRGHRAAPSTQALSEQEFIKEEIADPINRAMARILESSKGQKELTCVWCGAQSDEKVMRVHVKAAHASAIGLDKPSDAQLLSFQLKETKQELEAERAKE